ncbi:hypothetical protein XELAEV_180041602mg, partial [Xenopus laevis]
MAYTLKEEHVWIGVVRRIMTFGFACLVLTGVTWAFADSIPLVTDEYRILAFGIYGAFLTVHLVIQSLFAFLEHRKMKISDHICTYTKTVALTISAYQEDPEYLRECLVSVKNIHYPPDKLKVIMVIDGNIFAGEDVGTFCWENNYHSWKPENTAKSPDAAQQVENDTLIRRNQEQSDDLPESTVNANYEIEVEDPMLGEVKHLIKSKRCVCLMQKWGGKREVMYTAFKALGESVDYVQ